MGNFQKLPDFIPEYPLEQPEFGTNAFLKCWTLPLLQWEEVFFPDRGLHDLLSSKVDWRSLFGYPIIHLKGNDIELANYPIRINMEKIY